MSALLRLPNEVNVEDKMIRVDEAISILHLDKAKNTQVGSPHKKVPTLRHRVFFVLGRG